MTVRKAIRCSVTPILGGLALCGIAAAAWAAVPVEESVATSSNEPAADRAGTPQGAIDARAMSGGDSSRLTELFYQLQVLQQEVQELRGLVEEQRYQIERLARDQQEQYLDLDRRMQALRGGGQSPATSGGDRSGSSADAVGGVGSGAASGVGSEREAYTAAFDLMKQRQFEASANAFQALVETYPNGAYTPNAYYWLGELQLAQDDNEAARQSFAQVVNLYPDHQKVPDALYKLGVVYHRLGDVERAREYLNRVRSQHPQSSAAGLAQTYLAEL